MVTTPTGKRRTILSYEKTIDTDIAINLPNSRDTRATQGREIPLLIQGRWNGGEDEQDVDRGQRETRENLLVGD